MVVDTQTPERIVPAQEWPAPVPLPSTAWKARAALPWYRTRTLHAFEAFKAAEREYQMAAHEEVACQYLAAEADEDAEGTAA
jgi:hypothetical protein